MEGATSIVKRNDIPTKSSNVSCHVKRDVYETFNGRTLIRIDEMKTRGISDGSTVQITSQLRDRGNVGQDE